jgi:hypothetical protein
MGYTPYGKPAENVVRAVASREQNHLQTSAQRLEHQLDTRTAAYAALGRAQASMLTAAETQRTELVRQRVHEENPVVLMNNTRLAVSDMVPGLVLDNVSACVQHCENTPTCGGIVFREAWEPVVGNNNCPGALKTDSCCYPAPLLSHYPLTGNATCEPPNTCLGFIAAIVRCVFFFSQLA